MAIEIECFKGLPLKYNVILKSTDGLPIDLTGALIVMKVRKSIEDEDVLAESSTLNGGIKIINPENGEFIIEINEQNTKNFPEYSSFDILVVTIDGEPYLIAKEGRIKSKLFVSR